MTQKGKRKEVISTLVEFHLSFPKLSEHEKVNSPPLKNKNKDLGPQSRWEADANPKSRAEDDPLPRSKIKVDVDLISGSETSLNHRLDDSLRYPFSFI